MAQVYADKYCFVHIPKTGGKWTRRVLQAAGMDVTDDLSDNHAPMPRPWDEGVSFVTVRHPATWMASWWAHMHRYPQDERLGEPGPFNKEKPYDWLVRATAPYQDLPFESHARAIQERWPGFVQMFFAPYLQHVDHVLHQETLRDDLVGVVGPLPELAPFNVGDNSPEPSRELVEMIEAIDGDYGI